MPGVIMENGRNGSHTNHDRDQRPNGVNGANYVPEKSQEKGKGRAEPQQNMTPISPTIPNGLNGNFMDASQQQNGLGDSIPQDLQERINQLPPEIAHITQGYLPLSRLLSRLAQKTHSDLSSTILELAQMQIPSSTVNGNTSHITTSDDTSPENLAKKLRMLKFAQDAHTEWTKALVITGWSRRAEDVSRTIDLKIHLDDQAQYYENAVYELGEVKKGLIHARLPNPDLPTALEVLTTGKASWMPDLGYIQPPPLNAKEILKSLENLNTLLSIRLNLHDYDNIPLHFKDFTIKSGRVTFKVAGEFEIDLTIADEDPEAQFWFIDFRFMFWPSVPTLTPQIRYHIESKVNEALAKDGLTGCYKYLHEMVLTHKISEFKKQAIDLAGAKWIETLKVEALNRALSVQYWLDRYGSKGARSWIILGVHSGKRKDNRSDPKATSRLFIRWFRDSKEVPDLDIQFDTVNITTESLLKTVIAKHVSHILTSIHDNLAAKPLFANRELALSLSISLAEPAESELKVQLTNEQHLTVKIEPISGRILFSPASRLITECENRLYVKSPNPANDGHSYIELLRGQLLAEEIVNRGLSVGWMRIASPGLKPDALQPYLPKGPQPNFLWFRRPGWSENWCITVMMSPGGEQWLLLETADAPANISSGNAAQGRRIISFIKVPSKLASPVPTYEFLSTLNIFSAALVSHYCNLRSLHGTRAAHMLRQSRPSKAVTLPSIYIKLSELLVSKGKSARTKDDWTKGVVRLTFQGLELVPPKFEDPLAPIPESQASGDLMQRRPTQERAVMISEARMIVPGPGQPNVLVNINEKVDKDIAFDPETGSFAFRLRSRVGESVIPDLVERLVRVERLVEFIQVFQKHEKSLKCESVSLGKIVFTYGSVAARNGSDVMDLDTTSYPYKATVDFNAMETNMTLVLEQNNPHLRISDYLAMVLNGPGGLNDVASLLPLTLPVLRSLDAIENAWTPAPDTNKGDVFVNVRAVDWYMVRYNLKQMAPTPDSPPQMRKIMFEVRLRHRRGDPWWYIKRSDTVNRTSKEVDEIDEALKPVWNSKGLGWQGMRVSGVAQMHGVEELLGKVDEVIRNLPVLDAEAPAPVPTLAPTSAPAAVPTVAPSRQARPQGPQQQQRQQPTPNQSQGQSQSQGRGIPLKREVVEID
ncbi:MED14-domain-containing protein [Stipitochalara longipes BDJ]|nr:MED14-domain-containing protein [Stipitochalara longipes BDJ]